MQKFTPKLALILSISLLVAALHIIGPLRQTPGPWHDWYYSYFSDLTLPFSFYFLLCISEKNIPQLRAWWVKAGLVFGAATAAEILQFFGIDALGVTFDALDIVMYASGTLSAVLLEQGVFKRWLPFWAE